MQVGFSSKCLRTGSHGEGRKKKALGCLSGATFSTMVDFNLPSHATILRWEWMPAIGS